MVKKEIYKKIGKKIAVARKNKKITRIELAEKLGVTQSMITAYETGSENISIPRLLGIAKILGKSPGDLLE